MALVNLNGMRISPLFSRSAQISCIGPRFGGTVSTAFHFSIGVLYAVLFAYLFDLIIPLHWETTTAAVFVFTAFMIYAKPHPLTMKFAIVANLLIIVSRLIRLVNMRIYLKNLLLSAVVGVISCLIASFVPWMDLASRQVRRLLL